MKIKIISTGEVVNIADYAKVTLDKCDSYGNPIEISFEDVELIKDTSDTTDWNQVRIQAAIAAMQGLLSNEKQVHIKVSEAAYMSVLYSDALVKELKGE